MTQLCKSCPATPRQAAARKHAIDRRLDHALFKAFADPTRALLIACIAKCGRGCSVGEIAECCSVDVSVVSRHLSMLARAGVLEPRRRGRAMLYQVRYRELSRALRDLADAIDACGPVENDKKEDRCGGGC
ncbi:MAG: winged helix-turn-helix transcriptional regulator [Phycisphaeraceae bacterium]|nr:winged helix-turn-helix transcriptional regulator [Phycisphaerae bacterium]MBX3391453.1 winged helix-turn-helix transcriptional regulator [Phycisphaeraceae bacterium]HRJ50992.1 metalloregulator ArsR/SmtB family transcription factor [Phycisphaerales bacterium]